MTDIKSHTFEDGDMLTLEAVDSYAGYHGLTVYTVHYLEKDTDPDTGETMYNGWHEDNYMSQAAALAGFGARLASADPFQALQQDGGIPKLVLDTFKNYLGEGTFRSAATPDEWGAFTKHVLEATFGRDSHYYNGEKIHETLDGLETTSSKSSTGQADVILEIPAWKLLEIMTALTTLAMVVKQQSRSPMKKAA
jgi:hypothetical protein